VTLVPPRAAWLLLLLSASLNAAPAACAPCHQSETEAFAKAAMTRALEAGRNSAILQANPQLTTQIGGYSYRIDHSVYTVTDGKDTLRIPIDWAFGQGTAGQTYLFQHEGRWYESRVSYFSALHGLDLTIGMQGITPHTLLEAAGRLMAPAETGQCFDCHATRVAKSPHPDLSAMLEGVQCERCHGGTEAHLRTQAPMRKLGALTTEEMSDFCGQCHRTWSQISINGPRGIQNVRFQPYRLGNSRCYDVADNRIRCTACHDPHRAVITSPAAYDVKCLACHATKGCRVATKDCVTCHMPRLDLPGAHAKFTDHKIRVVRANEPYPD
jgi:hypothetical protein